MTATSDVGAAPGTTAGTYVYGVVHAAARPPRLRGVADGEVGAIAFQDVAALASACRAVPLRARRRDLHAHSDVLTAVVARDTVLPVRFGTVFESPDVVQGEFLEPCYRELRRLLDAFEGLVELRVKASYRLDAILEEIVRASPRIASLREGTRGRPEAQTRALRLELGSAVAGELERRRAADTRGVVNALRGLAEAVKVEDPATEEQVFRASFLVRRSRVRSFDEAMTELAERGRPRVRFTYLGPLPPHSFVEPLERRWGS